MIVVTDDYDSPWKEALEAYLADGLALLFPEVHAGIDWVRGYEFLDKELQQVAPEAELGPRVVDKLVRVWQRDGDESWVLVHLEVQAQQVPDFAERMYVYHYRLFDRYHRRVASLAILADESPAWRPSEFALELWGCRVHFTFPVAKLLDFRDQLPALEESRNPFVAVLLAHLGAQETRRDPDRRLTAKFRVLRRLYDLGYNESEIRRLYRLVDWLMRLPRELESELLHRMEQFEEVRLMPYVTSAERIGMERGLEQGLAQGRREGLVAGLELALQLKFGAEAEEILPEVRLLTELAVIERIYARLAAAESVAEVRRLYR